MLSRTLCLRLALGSLALAPLLAGRPAWAQTASCPTRSANILFLEDEAWAAVEELDRDGYERAILQVRAALGCLSEAITPPAAAAMHRAEALSSVMNEDHAGAVLSFRSALRLEPAWTLPDALGTDGSPFARAYFEASVPMRASPEPVVTAGRLRAFLDGAPVSQRFTGLPVVFQYVGTDNVPTWTAYLRAGEAAPPPPELADTGKGRRHGSR